MHESLLAFIDGLKRHALAQQDVDMAITAAWACGRLLWANHTGIYRDDDLESVLLGKLEPSHSLSSLPPVRSGRILHVISEPYAVGGHTRLLEKLVAMSPEASDVLVTRAFNNDSRALRVSSSITVICHESGLRLATLAETIVGYEKVILHIHPDDIKAALAVGLARRQRSMRVIFVNHADHAFSFGFHVSDMVAEISAFGFQLSVTKRRVLSSFLGIPVPDGDGYLPCLASSDGMLHVVSAGSALKFRPAHGLSFPFLATTLLKQLPYARMTVVGPNLRKNWWWCLPKLRFPRRLSLCPVLPYQDYLRVMSTASVYIDSMPMSGGTVLPEVRAQGTPVTGVMTGATGYTPFDETKYPDIYQLIRAIKELSVAGESELLARNNDSSLLAAAASNHGYDSVRARMFAMLDKGTIFSPIANIGTADITFYEQDWKARGVANIDRKIIAYVLALPDTERTPLLRAMWQAMSWRQRVRLLFRRLFLLVSAHSDKMVMG